MAPSEPAVTVEHLEAIAAIYDTPIHVLDLARLRANYRRLERALAGVRAPVDILYSVKTNYLPLVCAELRAAGAGADVVSGYELQAVLALGFAPDRIVFNGPLKTPAELAEATSRGILVNIDGPGEVRVLQRLATEAGRVVDVGLRINPNTNVYPSVDPTYNQLMARTVARSKFGWNIDTLDAARMLDVIAAAPNLRLTAVQCHVGSQITDTSAFVAAIHKAMAFVEDARRSCDIAVFNFGGGLGVPGIHRDRSGPLRSLMALHDVHGWPDRREAFDLDRLVDGLNEGLRRYGLTDIRLACEPGRAIVSDAMCLLTRVASLKRTSHGDWVILDGGLNLLATAGVGESHDMVAVREPERPTKPFMVAGPLCYEGDVFSYDQRLPATLSEGELLVILDTGAYSVSRATNFIRPRAGVVAVDGDVHELCWARERFDDIFAFHRATRFHSEVPAEKT